MKFNNNIYLYQQYNEYYVHILRITNLSKLDSHNYKPKHVFQGDESI